MDENLARLNRIYPNGSYVLIAPFKPEQWENREYDSSHDNKAPRNKWKTKPLSYEEAQEAVENGDRIGWVVPKGMVVVDIDNKDDARAQEYIERLLTKFEVKYSYNYTYHGVHILFKDPSQNIKSDSRCKCGLNLAVDTRANGSGYIILPCNDPHREWGRWNDYVEEIPYFLLPLLKDTTISFIGMKDGDGRNDALFRWRSQLERTQKLTAEQVEKCIRIINENLFETAIPNNELFKTVLRERDKVEKLDATEKENIFNKIADEIIAKFDIISYGRNFYKFNGTYFKQIEDVEIERLIHFEVSKNLSKAARKEILEFLIVKTQVKQEDFDKDWHKIAVKNGILNLVTGELESPNKTDINTIYLPYDYDPDPPYSPRIDQFMKDICNGDPIKMLFLYQVAGYCLLKKNLFQKFFVFKGEGGTGKSTFKNLIEKMVGGDMNCSHITLNEFDKDYHLAHLMSKLVNTDDDLMDGRALENTGKFKSIVSGEKIAVRQIYKDVMSFTPYATCIFNCNKLPKIMDKTTGMYRRMVLVELNHRVEKPDLLFMNKVTDADMQYFLFKAVQAIKLAIEEGHFKISQSEQELLNQFKRRQSPLNEWLYENDIRTGDIHEQRCISLYNQFVEWCIQNGYMKQMTAMTFKEDICNIYDVELDFRRLNEGGAPVQVFVKRGIFDKDYRPF